MKIVCVAGGTGGHIFPAVATMKKIEAEGHDVLWMTTERSNEADIAKRYSLQMVSYNVEGIQRRISLQPFRAILKMVKAIFASKKRLKSENIDAVIAYGGYVCGPVLFAARLLKIPFFLHEQNSVPGVVNRYFAKRAEKIFLGLPLAPGSSLKGLCKVVGNPVRDRLDDYSDFDFPEAVDRTKKTILICGGSQGAMSMNKVLVEAVKALSSQAYQVIWQTGKPGLAEIQDAFKGDENVIALASMNDLYPYYSIATLLIGRSGASTISEAALFGLPSIFIPLPWSAENHQWHNAGFVEEAGWGYRIEQGDSSSEEIMKIVNTILVKNQDTYKKLKEHALDSGRVNASVIVSKEVIERVK